MHQSTTMKRGPFAFIDYMNGKGKINAMMQAPEKGDDNVFANPNVRTGRPRTTLMTTLSAH